MGNCVSGISNCFGLAGKDTPFGDKKVSHVFPTPLVESVIEPSDKHDDKFYYIKNEEEIDKAIDKLDETLIMNEVKAAILEHTLADLKNQKHRFVLFPSLDSIDRFSTVREEEIEEDVDSPMKKKSMAKTLSPTPKSKGTMNFTEMTASQVKKETVTQGNLLMEVQRGHFLHSKFLHKNALSQPYVVVKIYHSERMKGRDMQNKTIWTDINQFQTQTMVENIVRPEFDELFEHQFIGDKKVSSYSFGFKLFYKVNANQEDYQVGYEQVFSVGSLLDQKMQVKQIDFKDPESKGVLARLRVRFQFLHDAEQVKERLVREIKTKIEKLNRIKEKHPNFEHQKERKSVLQNIKKSISMRKESEYSSISSTHENDDTGYYVT